MWARRRTLGPVLLVTLLLVAPGASAASQRAELVFSADGNLVSMAADGSGRKPLAPSPAGREDFDPVWSPDGSALAFVRAELDESDDPPSSRLLVAASDGSGTATLRAEPRAQLQGPSWSPDGTRLAVAKVTFARRSILSEIVVVTRDGSTQRTLLRARSGARDTLVYLLEPAWSPDGRTIAYTRVRLDRRSHYGFQLRSVGVDGGRDRLLARHGSSADWSPDGSRIAYMSIRDRNGERCGSDECFYAPELYVMSAADGRQIRLTHGKGFEEGPDWSPDGNWITFSSDRNYPAGEHPEIYSIRSDGDCLTWLTNGSADSTSPAWRPEPGAIGDPGGCGAVDRTPLSELDLEPARSIEGIRVYWLGRSFAGLMLAGLESGWRGGVGEALSYDDCVRFDPSECPPPLSLSQNHVCDIPELLLSAATKRPATRHVRGALVAGGSLVVTGTTQISVALTGETRRERARMLRRAVRELRPVGRRAVPRRLPAPVIGRPLARRLRRAAALVNDVGVRETVRRMNLPNAEWLRAHLELLQELRSGGGIRTTRCGG